MKTLVAVAELESGHTYTAVGNETRTGDRAYGKYQVMGSNVGNWTQTHLGKRMTIKEFLADELAQEKLAGIIFTKRIGDRQNIHDPIAMWFSGQPLRGNNAQDVNGMTVPQYVAKILHIKTAYASQ